MTFYFYADQRFYDKIENHILLKGFSVAKMGERGYVVEIDDGDEVQQEVLRDLLEAHGHAWQEEKDEFIRRNSKGRFHETSRSHAQKTSW